MSTEARTAAMREKAVREELRFRLENVADYYRRCGETGEAPDPDLLDRELAEGTSDILAAATAQDAQPLVRAA